MFGRILGAQSRVTWVLVLVVALFAGTVTAVSPSAPAKAATASDFNPGDIISDAVFFDGSAMSANAVQNFLQAKVSTCLAGYTCLKDWRQSTPTMPAVSGQCNQYSGAGDERASDIIAKVGIACGISQKVLLVLLEKEQSLVTDNWPLASQYRSATGFGCPDTAACDASFNGFFYQIYFAAKQFKKYAATPGDWRYKAGQNNQVLFHPNASCGSSTVYIQNQATAGLYIYTPYQPNAAALSNLYGTGDGCSAYGNRNFWRLFSDWFGTTHAGSLVRSVENPTIYLVSGGNKYPVSTFAMMAELSPLGGFTYVSQGYLDGLQTGIPFKRIARDQQGSIFFIDSGIKLPFQSCAMVEAYGGNCSPSGYTQLEDAQLAAYVTGPAIGSVLHTVEGHIWYMSNGKRSEVFDDSTLQLAGIVSAWNVLTDKAVAEIPLGAPLLRDGLVVQARGQNNFYLINNLKKMQIPASDALAMARGGQPSAVISPEGLSSYSDSTDSFTGVFSSGTPSTKFVLANGSRYELAVTAAATSAVPIALSDATASAFPVAGKIEAGTFIKPSSRPTIYVSMSGDIRPIPSWETFLALSSTPSPVWLTVPDAYIASLVNGPHALAPTFMYRNSDNPTVYVVNGLSDKVAISSFVYPFEAGMTKFAFAPDAQLTAYPTNASSLQFGIRCGVNNYVSANGSIHLIPAALSALYPINFVQFDEFSCRKIAIGNPATRFIRTLSGSIYLLKDGQKQPVSSMQRFAELSQGEGWTQVHDWLAQTWPVGPPA